MQISVNASTVRKETECGVFSCTPTEFGESTNIYDGAFLRKYLIALAR